jgi:hypothetical protein
MVLVPGFDLDRELTAVVLFLKSNGSTDLSKRVSHGIIKVPNAPNQAHGRCLKVELQLFRNIHRYSISLGLFAMVVHAAMPGNAWHGSFLLVDWVRVGPPRPVPRNHVVTHFLASYCECLFAIPTMGQKK